MMSGYSVKGQERDIVFEIQYQLQQRARNIQERHDRIPSSIPDEVYEIRRRLTIGQHSKSIRSSTPQGRRSCREGLVQGAQAAESSKHSIEAGERTIFGLQHCDIIQDKFWQANPYLL